MVSNLAKELGIPSLKFEILPDEKLSLEALQAKEERDLDLMVYGTHFRRIYMEDGEVKHERIDPARVTIQVEDE